VGEGYQGRRKVLLHQVSYHTSPRTGRQPLNFRSDRNQSSLLAFTIPRKWKAGTGVSIVATHIDSPNLRVRPISKRSKEGYLQVGVETYGGGIWHSWLDRDLSLAGRIITADKNGSFASKLIKIDRPLLRIPTLAIHRA
jgi:aspartyl aminopeptidase